MEDCIVTPQKVRDLLSSFFYEKKLRHGAKADDVKNMEGGSQVLLSGKLCSTTQRQESPDRAAPPTSPASLRSYASFVKRLKTYSPITWFGKPLELSPAVCSRYGWENNAYDLLHCSACSADLCCSLPLQTESEEYNQLLAAMRGRLTSGHCGFCTLAVNPCPESFLSLALHDVQHLRSSFQHRLSTLCTAGGHLPDVDYSQMEIWGFSQSHAADFSLKDSCRDGLFLEENRADGLFLEENRADGLCSEKSCADLLRSEEGHPHELSPMQGHLDGLCSEECHADRLCLEESHVDGVCPEECVIGGMQSAKSVALALTGWMFLEGSNDILACGTCMREVGLWNFSPNIDGSFRADDSDLCHGSDNGASLSKKRKTEPLGLCMDPIGCHFAWCPWVCRHAWPEAATDLALNCAGVVPGDPDQETVTQSISSCGDGLPAPREVPGWAAAARLVVPGLLSRSQQCVSRRLNELSPKIGVHCIRKVIRSWASSERLSVLNDGTVRYGTVS